MATVSVKSQKGFTLVELVVVIGILGVLAATATPMVNNFMDSSKEQAYLADKATLQAAVDAFYSAPANPRHLGQRQYPIKAVDSTGSLNLWSDADSNPSLTPPLNPLKGTRGGEPTWRDGGDGIRTEENLNAEAQSLARSGSGWYVQKVNLNASSYAVDTRDYFIDFNKLVNGGLLEQVPASASPDNRGVGATGSYSWYVNPAGRVDSLYVHFPTSGPAAAADNRGFVAGVYP